MIYWIINALILSIWWVLYKKSLVIMNWIISDKFYQLIGAFFTILFSSVLYIYYDLEQVNIYIFIMLIATAFLWIIWELFEQYAYKNERLSVLVPYWEFQSVFTVIFWFLFFTDNSIISLFFTLLAWLTLVIWSINLKKISFNKYCLALIVKSLFSTFKILLYWFILKSLAIYNVVFYNILIVFFILLLVSIFNREIKKIKKINIRKYKYLFLENFVRFFIWLLSLFIISELWIVQAVLIWMMYMVTSLISASLFLKEKISKKEIIIALVVSLCIWCWVLLW